uniref:Uncharacterized protein n=1 Tax=Anopheles arabiensis TaxID=7173 RepID=A0A182IH15_ANOAR
MALSHRAEESFRAVLQLVVVDRFPSDERMHATRSNRGPQQGPLKLLPYRTVLPYRTRLGYVLKFPPCFAVERSHTARVVQQHKLLEERIHVGNVRNFPGTIWCDSFVGETKKGFLNV